MIDVEAIANNIERLCHISTSTVLVQVELGVRQIAANFDPLRLAQDGMTNDWRRVKYSMQKAAEVGQLNVQINTIWTLTSNS